MPSNSQYPLWAVNRASVAFEAIALARRFDRGAARRSHDPHPSRVPPASQQSHAPLRRVGIALVVAVASIAAAGLIA